MPALAKLEDLEALLGREFNTDAQRERAEAALRIATTRIQAEARQHFFLVEDDVVELHPQFGRAYEISLPERPVVAVGALTIDGSTIASYEVTRWGRVRATVGDLLTPFPVANRDPRKPALVTVTYTHGYADGEIPQELQDICLVVATRLLANPEGFTQEGMGQYQASYGDAAGVTLTQDEIRLLRRWRPR